MSSTLKVLKAISDATRLRILALLVQDELSVHELQEVTHMGQSRISTHLGLLQETGLVTGRREIEDRQATVCQTDATLGVSPDSPVVRPAMV